MALKETKSLTDVNVSEQLQYDSSRSKAETKTNVKQSRLDPVRYQITESPEDFPVCSVAVQEAHDELTDHWLNMIIEKEEKLREMRTNLLNVHLDGCRMDHTAADDWRLRSEINENRAAILEQKLNRLKKSTDFRWVSDDVDFTDVTPSEEKFLKKLKLMEKDFEFLEEFTAKCRMIFGREKYRNMFGRHWDYPPLFRDGVLDVIRQYCHVFGNEEDFPVQIPDYPAPDYVMARKRRSGYKTYRVQFEDALYDFIRCGTVQVLPRVSEVGEMARILESRIVSIDQTESGHSTPTEQHTRMASSTTTNHGADIGKFSISNESLKKGSHQLVHIPKPPETPMLKGGRNLRVLPNLKKLPQTSSNQAARNVTDKRHFALDKMSISTCWPINVNNVNKFIATDPRCGRLKFKFRNMGRKSRLPINVAYLMRESMKCSSNQRQLPAIRRGRVSRQHAHSQAMSRVPTNLQKKTKNEDCQSPMNRRQMPKQKVLRIMNLDQRRRRFYAERTVGGISNIRVRVEYLLHDGPMNVSRTGNGNNVHLPKLFTDTYASRAPQTQRVKLPVIKNLRRGVQETSPSANFDIQRANQRRKTYAKSVTGKEQNWALPDRFHVSSKA